MISDILKDMTYYPEVKAEENLVIFHITVPADGMELALERAFEKRKGQITVPGYRPGKGSREEALKAFGKDFFLQEAIEDIINDIADRVVGSTDIPVTALGNIGVSKAGAGEDLVLTIDAAVDGIPVLGQYKGLPGRKEIVVTDEDIAPVIDELRQKNLDYRPVNRAAKAGDELNVVLHVSVDGERYTLDKRFVIGGGTEIKEIEDAFIGVEIRRPVSFEVSYDEDSPYLEYRGKRVEYEGIIRGISEICLPDADDKFAMRLGFESFEDMKAVLKNNMYIEKDTENIREIVDLAVANAKIDIPQIRIEREAMQEIEEFKARLSEKNLSFDDYLRYTEKSEEDIIKEAIETAESKIKNDIVLREIARVENLVPSDEEIKDFVVEQMSEMGYDMSYEEIIKNFGREIYDSAKGSVMSERAILFIRDNAVKE